MTINYSETRQAQIYEILSAQTLLNKTSYANNDLLEALKSFADALLGIVMDDEHASHLTIRNLSYYLYNLAFTVDLTEDPNVKYTVKQLDLLSKRIHSLETGVRGEQRAHRAMFGVDGPNHILKNAEIVIDGEPYESDLIVINRHGIRIVEVKNKKFDTYIDENGCLCSDRWQDKKNVSVQMANQRGAIHRVIETAFPGNERMITIAENIKSVLLSASNAAITDTRGREIIKNCDNIADYLNNTSTGVELTREEINLLADTIEKASVPKTYDVNYDYIRVAKAFSIAIAKIEYASDKAKEEVHGFETYSTGFDINAEEEDEEFEDVIVEDSGFKIPRDTVSNNGWKVASSIAVTAAVLGIGLKILKKLI